MPSGGLPRGRRVQEKNLATPEDKGIVARPRLMPHYQPHVVNDQVALLTSDTGANALYGRLWVDLLPLLDGTRDRHEIAAALADRHPPLTVQTTLVSMAAKEYICSADYRMDAGRAGFWSGLGATPRFAEQRLSAARVAVRGEDPALAAAVEACGVAPLDEPEAASREPLTLAVVATLDYLAEAHRERNREYLEAGTPWMLVATRGIWPMFGPVFRPADKGACWDCLAHRLSGNREVDRFVRAHGGRRSLSSPILFPPFADAVRRLAAVQAALWIVLGEFSALHDHAITVRPSGAMDLHRAANRPQCRSCGDERLFRPDRASVPIVLGPSPKTVRNSGGVRAVSPAATLRRFDHLVDPVSGVVTELTRTTPADDDWLHVYWAGSNLALSPTSLYALRSSLRTKSSGKGATPGQARASALCEALERYSGVFHGDEIRRPEKLSGFAEGEAIHPNEVHRFSDHQLENAAEINARGTRFNYIPKRLDPDAVLDWSPVWSLTEERRRYLPTSLLYYAMPPPPGGDLYATPDSNGCAAGNTLEEAILQGFLELVERDAFACWWYNRVRLPELDLDSFDDPYLSGSRDYYRRMNRDMWVLDATHDFGIPAFIGISHRTDKEFEDILYSAGAHLDPRIAALRAMCELNQYLDGVKGARPDGTGYAYDDPESVHWWRTARLADFPYLVPAPGAALRSAADYRAPDTEDVREDVEFCRRLAESKGMEFLVLDQTRPDVKLPVAKVIVPGMRHFWARFAPGRLYEVPVELGWLEQPLAEADLNPTAVFI